MPLTALASVGVGLGHSALSNAAWVGGMAIFEALATVACRNYVLRTTPAGQDANAMSSYLFVIISSAFCGSVLGGVLADRIGAGRTFFFGAFVAILAAVLGVNTIIGATMPELAPKSRTLPPNPAPRSFSARPCHRDRGADEPRHVGLHLVSRARRA